MNRNFRFLANVFQKPIKIYGWLEFHNRPKFSVPTIKIFYSTKISRLTKILVKISCLTEISVKISRLTKILYYNEDEIWDECAAILF